MSDRHHMRFIPKSEQCCFTKWHHSKCYQRRSQCQNRCPDKQEFIGPGRNNCLFQKQFQTIRQWLQQSGRTNAITTLPHLYPTNYTPLKIGDISNRQRYRNSNRKDFQRPDSGLNGHINSTHWVPPLMEAALTSDKSPPTPRLATNSTPGLTSSRTPM